MFNFQRYRALLLHFNPQKSCPILPLTSFPSSLKLKFCTSTTTSQSESESFRVSYLINNLGFTPQAAQKASKILHFKTSERPESFFNLFRSHGFSDTNIRHMLTKEPWLLKSRPHHLFLPKLEFFLSNGVSACDIVRMLTTNPRILHNSLENRIIPLHELLKRFLKSDLEVFCIIPYLSNIIVENIKLMVDYGVCDSGIARLLRSRPSFCNFKACNLLNMLEEVKGLGFNPSKCTFAVALLAMKGGRENLWDEKVDAFKKWGWSYETVLQAFRRQPNMMMASIDRIHLVMNFWVNEMGWNSLVLVKEPEIFAFSFQRRVVPRAAVLQFLLKKGLRDKDASLVMPFSLPEKKFLNKFVLCFEEESAYLLKLYEEKMNHASTKKKKKNPGVPFTKSVPP